ncbi:MAG: transcriptional regulator, AraC family [Sphingomonas bacterium]|uniref:helix-turn-helix domain-containing protein n=1 Tax=Sphingomonas bacterium TaxID=1895847 RepID=UPI00261F72D2|nr:AraC family transcriptional regulator [Sphingomonas bacterium]MDB5709475.1 transcriptional regulator, AraC family [Sphingomonas bacterium]
MRTAQALKDSIEAVILSPEMTMLIGTGVARGVSFPDDAALLVFGFGGVGAPATLRLVADTSGEALGDPEEGVGSLSCIVARTALDRLFGCAGEAEGRYHLTTTLRTIALAITECTWGEAARETYRAGKAIELLCETMQALADGALVPVAAEGAMNQADSRRLVAARRIIDEQWSEKLTLDSLARACGINRAKLTRGFRELYRCTVAEAITERRLIEASRKLRTTDLPVSSIGYASGYLNNASFSRAFGRRFGVSPSEYRGCAAVAA